MLLAHVLDLTVVHEHDITKVLRSYSREAGSRWRRLCLLANFEVLDYAIIKTVDAFRQTQLACAAPELRCTHVIVLHVQLEEFRPLGESLA